MVTLERPSPGEPSDPFGAPIMDPRQASQPPLVPTPPSQSHTPQLPQQQFDPYNLQPVQEALPDHNPYRQLQKQRTGQSEGSYPGQPSYLSSSAGAAVGPHPSSLLPNPNPSPNSQLSASYTPSPHGSYHATAPRSHSVSAIGQITPQPLVQPPPSTAPHDGIFHMEGVNPVTTAAADPFVGDIQPIPQAKSADWWESPTSSQGGSPVNGNLQTSLEDQLENEFHRGRGLIAQPGSQPLPSQQSQQAVPQNFPQPVPPSVPQLPPHPNQQQSIQQPAHFAPPMQLLDPQPIAADPFGPGPVAEVAPQLPPKPQKEPPISLLDIDDVQSGAHKEAVPDHGAQAPIPVASDPTAQPPTSSIAPTIPLETYQIKHVRFLDPQTNKLTQSSILIQNENGPCPLIALVNVLSMSRETVVLSEGLRIRETLSLELLLNVVCEELVITGSWIGDLSELFKFLMNLRTGMNVNPKFISDDITAEDFLASRNVTENRPLPQPRPGDFERTRELILYSAFNIPLVHGWLPAPTSPMFPVLVQHARDFERAQDLIIQQQFILEKSSKGEAISPDDTDIVAKGHEIQEFLESTGTQLTSYGLNILQTKLPLGSWNIFFRNDHFSVLYKHASTGELYTLVTDSGYASYEEIVWESLVDGTGRGGAYFSGDFRPVGFSHGEGGGNISQRQSDNILDPNRGEAGAGWQLVQNRRSSRQQVGPAPATGGQRRQQVQSLIPPDPAPIVPPDTTGDTTDYDLALAIHLQQEEEERAARIAQNRANLNPARITNLTSANQPVRSLVNPGPPTGVRPRASSNNFRPAQPPRPTGRQAEELRAAANQGNHQEEIPPPYAPADPNPGSLSRHHSFPAHGTPTPAQTTAYTQMNPVYGQSSGSPYPGAGRGRRTSGQAVGVNEESDKKCSIM
ncbi:Ubiquitin carboxyl-terminal hydrolase [Drechslerella dactyloides]|uniref:Ubiquitin carboxyl-terminal hydrolase n=1 Tax=Drechslerella dactyloides TaxID=74499 RepID=A0AAD6J0L4_DREDA|nr:Ubiquitin carboxyl-terminal hydrolase [Drechslerella dactyloides]